MTDDGLTFGSLLKRYRRSAHLSQEELATSAGYSSHYVSMLERGVRSPHPLTIDLLAGALTLSPEDRASLQASAQSRPAIRPRATGMPPAPPSLLGREQDEADLVDLLERDEVRLVTVTGPGGVGKTSLAQSVAVTLQHTFADGISFINFAEEDNHDAVLPTIARALTPRDVAGRSPLDRLDAFLRRREMLLLLDSFERVVDGSAALSDLLAGCPRVKLLVTSRIPLRLRLEHEFRTRPLGLPHRHNSPSADDLRAYPAIALFVQRARLVKPEFALQDDNAGVIADICQRLDGLPLAIELAAARLSHLPLPALRDRLEHRLQILTGGTRDLPDRQQRMRDTIAWSYDLLAPPDQALLRRLSVFAGSWSLEAAEEVCAGIEPGGGVLDGLRTLVDGSLVVALDDMPGDPRYRLLDTIREYALEQSMLAGELETARRRHSEYYLRLGDLAEPELQDRHQESWYALLERDHDNLRTALAGLLEAGDAAGALRLGGAVWRFWQRHGDIREGRLWLDRALALHEPAPEAVRARALWGASWLAYFEADYARSAALSREHLALARAWGDALSVRNALTGLGMVALAEGKYGDALQSLQAALDACEPLGNIWHRATSSLNLGHAAMLTGDLDGATTLYTEALALYRERRDDVFAARALQHLGYVALLRGEYSRADTLFMESVRALLDLNEKAGIADGLEGIAAARAGEGGGAEVAPLLEAATVLREEIGVPSFPSLRSVWEPLTIAARAEAGEEAWAAARSSGRAVSWREVVTGLLTP